MNGHWLPSLTAAAEIHFMAGRASDEQMAKLLTGLSILMSLALIRAIRTRPSAPPSS